MPAGQFPAHEPRSFYESPAHPRQPPYDEKSTLRFMNSETEHDDDNRRYSMEKGPMNPVVEANAPPPYQANNMMPVAAPRPGYAAPIAMLNRPEPAAMAGGRQPYATTLDTNRQFASPAPSTPHPLQAPMTPITPVFARPNTATVQFAGGNRPIMRGNSEETLLPKRGEKGDDFWRRFSMIAHEESSPSRGKKQSSWLEKTQSRSSTWSKKVWIIGLLLLACVLGAIGLAWYITHDKPDHQAPIAIGGGAGELATAVSSVSGRASSTVLHVTPTLTIENRALPTQLHDLHAKSFQRKRRHAKYANGTVEQR